MSSIEDLEQNLKRAAELAQNISDKYKEISKHSKTIMKSMSALIRSDDIEEDKK